MSSHVMPFNYQICWVVDGLCYCVVCRPFHVAEGKVKRPGFNAPVK